MLPRDMTSSSSRSAKIILEVKDSWKTAVFRDLVLDRGGNKLDRGNWRDPCFFVANYLRKSSWSSEVETAGQAFGRGGCLRW